MNFQFEQTNMITQQLRTGDVLNETILSLYSRLPRHEFVPHQYQSFAYSDKQIELGNGQRMMTPLEESLLLQTLDLKGHETVLEVGTGSGYLTGLLSCLCKHVVSIDYYAQFTQDAQKKLKQFNCNNTTLLTGDASNGWYDNAPYDVIILSAAIESLTDALRLQLMPGGKLFAIIGKSPVMKGMLYSLSHDETWSEQLVFETCLPSMITHNKPKTFVF